MSKAIQLGTCPHAPSIASFTPASREWQTWGSFPTLLSKNLPTWVGNVGFLFSVSLLIFLQILWALHFLPCTSLGLGLRGLHWHRTWGDLVQRGLGLARGCSLWGTQAWLWACPCRSCLKKGSVCEWNRGPRERITVHLPSMHSTELCWVCGSAKHLRNLLPTSGQILQAHCRPKEGISWMWTCLLSGVSSQPPWLSLSIFTPVPQGPLHEARPLPNACFWGK